MNKNHYSSWDSCSRPERDVLIEGRRGARIRVWSTGPKRRAASSVSNSLSLGPWCSWREPRPVLVLGIALSLFGNNEGHQNTRILSCHIHENGGAAVSLKSEQTSLKSPLMWRMQERVLILVNIPRFIRAVACFPRLKIIALGVPNVECCTTSILQRPCSKTSPIDSELF